ALHTREESVVSVDILQKTKKSLGPLLVYEGVSYDVTDPCLISIRAKSDEEPKKMATKGDLRLFKTNMVSNFVVWQEEAFCMSGGILWALNLKGMTWRKVTQLDAMAKLPLWEDSSSDDLLILTDSEKGSFMFTRFRPNFDKCEKVINCCYRIWPSGEESNAEIPTRTTEKPGDPFSIPDDLSFAILSNAETPPNLHQIMDSIGIGSVPYPKSQKEFEYLVWPEKLEEERAKMREAVNKMRQEDNQSDALSTLYSRECGVCACVNPRVRAAFPACGHMCCMACARELSMDKSTFACPFCRKPTEYLKMCETENICVAPQFEDRAVWQVREQQKRFEGQELAGGPLSRLPPGNGLITPLMAIPN
ncbi:hypothetical protein PFISCL1PPCAC_26128, partial [Pristionchus fissidentatus]